MLCSLWISGRCEEALQLLLRPIGIYFTFHCIDSTVGRGDWVVLYKDKKVTEPYAWYYFKQKGTVLRVLCHKLQTPNRWRRMYGAYWEFWANKTLMDIEHGKNTWTLSFVPCYKQKWLWTLQMAALMKKERDEELGWSRLLEARKNDCISSFRRSPSAVCMTPQRCSIATD